MILILRMNETILQEVILCQSFQTPDYPCFTCGKVKNVFDDMLRELTNIESALKNITEFRQKTQLPEHDHLMLFTE